MSVVLLVQVRAFGILGVHFFFILILVLDLLTCYFPGMVWWALVAVLSEYRIFGELCFFF